MIKVRKISSLVASLNKTSYRLTVRTLDFHSNNVGSIPAGLKLVNYNMSDYLNINLSFKKHKPEPSKVTVRYKFVTIIRPGTVGIRKNPYLYNVGQPTYNKTNKLIIKQSYILTV